MPLDVQRLAPGDPCAPSEWSPTKTKVNFQFFNCSLEIEELPGHLNPACIAGLNRVFHRLDETGWLAIGKFLEFLCPHFLKCFWSKRVYVHGSESHDNSLTRGSGGR